MIDRNLPAKAPVAAETPKYPPGGIFTFGILKHSSKSASRTVIPVFISNRSILIKLICNVMSNF